MILSASLALQFCKDFVCKGGDGVQDLSSQDLTARIFLPLRGFIAFWWGYMSNNAWVLSYSASVLLIGKSILQAVMALILDFAVRIREKGSFACLFEVILDICSTLFDWVPSCDEW